MLRGEPQFAGFWRRALAFMLDVIMFSIVLGLLLGPKFMQAELWSAEDLLSHVLSLLLTVWLWLKFLGTPGKLLLNCQIVDAQTFKPLSAKQAFLRYLSYFVSLLPLGLGFLWIAWDKRKQGFHDKIANTVVLYGAELETDDESQKSLLQLMAEVR